MIDFSAIETELALLVSGGATFTSTNTGRIREVVPINQMPSADVSIGGHRTTHKATRSYEVDVLVVIRSRGVKRNTNANAFKLLVENVCGALEGEVGTSFDVLRNITSTIGEDDTGDGHVVRTAAITMIARKD